MLTTTSLCDVGGEPAEGSIMESEARDWERTLETKSNELQLEFCHLFVPLPTHMAQSDHDETNTRYLLMHLQRDTPQISMAADELWIIPRGCKGNEARNVEPSEERHRNVLNQLSSMSFSISPWHPLYLCTLHCASTQWQSHNDWYEWVYMLHSLLWTFCFSYYLCSGDGCLTTATESQWNK